ncbi:MAG: LysE family translocator [Pseudomonadota bacterium]
MDVTGMLAVALAFFVVAASPGPANIANAVLAMDSGRSASFRFSLGLTSGIAVWGLVAATGLGAVLQGAVYVLSALKVLGGLYLLWLAWSSARGAMQEQPVLIEGTTGRKYFRAGLILNLSNPKTVVAWMAALAVGLDPDASLVSVAVGYAICVAVALGVNLGYMALFSMQGMMAAYRGARRWIGLVAAGLFAFAGLGLIRSAFSR